MYNTETIINTFQRLIHNKFNARLNALKNLKADASERKIYRLFVDDKSLIGIYNDNVKENLAFINFTESFVKLGFNVPQILAVSSDNLFYIEEDLGDISLFRFSSESSSNDMINCYKQALADLARFQIEAKDSVNYEYCYQTRVFNSDVISADAGKFKEYFLEKIKNGKNRNNFLNETVEILSKVTENTQGNFFLYRDFQPRNIMIKNNELYYIDYQSGRKGPLQYDVASFLYSGSINLSESERELLLEFYLNELSGYIEVDRSDFKEKFLYFALMRLIQVIGSYSFLYETRKDENSKKKILTALEKMNGLSKKIGSKAIERFLDSISH